MAKAIRRHTRLSLSADQAIPDETLTTLLFSSVDLDTRSIFNSASPGLLMVPNSSYTHARLTANAAWESGATGDQWITMIKNGALDTGFVRGQAAGIFEDPTMERNRINLSTPLLQVSSGDRFELQAWCNFGTDDVISANNTYFEIELYAYTEDFPGGCDSLWSNVVLLTKLNGADGATTATDVSTYGRTLTLGSSTFIDTDQSKFGGASALFHGNTGTVDGSQMFVSAADAPELSLGANSAWTVEMWASKSGDNSTKTLFSKYINTSNQREYWFFARSGELIFSGLNGTSAVFSLGVTASLGVGSMHHLAVERFSDSIAIYQNGTLLGSKSFTGSMFSGTAIFYIGKFRSAGFDDLPWHGWIDEFRMTVGAARYQGAFTPREREFPTSLCAGGGGGGPGSAAGGAYFRFFPGHARRVFPTSALRKYPRA